MMKKSNQNSGLRSFLRHPGADPFLDCERQIILLMGGYDDRVSFNRIMNRIPIGMTALEYIEWPDLDVKRQTIFKAG